MLFTALALLQGAGVQGAQDGEEKGRDRLIIESGAMVSDKRQKKDVCALCHQAPRCRMMLVIKYFILRTLQGDFPQYQ